MKEVDRALKFDPTNTELLAQKAQILAKQVETAKEKLNALKSVQGQVEQQFKNGEIGEEAYRVFQREVATSSAKLNNLEGELKDAEKAMNGSAESADDLADNVKKVGSESESSESKLKKFGEVAKAVGEMAAKAFKEAASFAFDFGKQSVEVGAEFDSSMSQVAATLGLSTEDIKNNVKGAGDTFDLLKEKAKEMGAATNFSASQSADGLNVLAMSGYSAEESVGMIEDVLHLAAAGSMDMAQAAGYVSGAMKGFNDSSKDSAYYADLMAKGATLANTSVAQLGEAMSSGAAGAAAYGQSADSMTVALLRLAEQGDVGSAAGTALSAAMKNLYTPTDKAKKALDKLGISAYDTNGKARDFNTVVNELSSAMSKYSEEEQNAYKQSIFGQQGLNAYNKMVVTATDKQKEWSAALADSSGEAANQYATMTDNLQGDIDIWNSALEGFQIEVSEKLMPTVRKFVNLGSESLTKLTEAFKDGDVEGAAEALGEIISDAISKIVEILPDVLSVVTTLIQSLVTQLLEKAPDLINSFFQIVTQIIQSLTTMMPTLIPQLVTAVTQIIQAIVNNLPMLLEAGLQLIQGLIQGIIQALPVLIGALPELILSIVNFVLESIPEIIQAGIQLLSALVTALPEIISQIVEVLPDIITGIIDALLDNLPLIIQAGVDLLIALVDNLPAIIDGTVAAIPKIISSILSALTKSLPKIIQAGVKLFVALIQDLPKITLEIVSKIPQIIGSIVSAFGSLTAEMINVGKNMLEGLWNGISGAAGWLWEQVSGWAGGLWDDICGFFGIHSPSTLFEKGLGKNMALGTGKGFVNAMEQVNKDMIKAIPTSFDVEPSMNIASLSRTAASLSNDVVAATQHLVFNLNVENFNNRSDKDMREIMDYAGRYFSAQIQRRDVVFG